jgi:hypothetical protein
MKKRVSGTVYVLSVVVAASLAFAATQLKPTKVLLVKSEKAKWLVVEKASSNTVVGDPTASGAKFGITLTPGGTQCLTLPASGWSPISTQGFKYKDPHLANGPVKVAQIKKTPSGTFKIQVQAKGSGVTVAPGNPTTSYVASLKIIGGGLYCSTNGTATPKKNDASQYKVVKDTTPAACVSTCSPSGAFID